MEQKKKKKGKKVKIALAAWALLAVMGLGWTADDMDELKGEMGTAMADMNGRVTALESASKKSVAVNGYTQLQWFTDPTSAGGREPFNVRRSRFAFSGKINSWTKFKIQIDFAALAASTTGAGFSPGFREAYMEFMVDADLMNLRLGQYHQPFGFENNYSSSSKKVADTPFYMGAAGALGGTDYDYGVFWFGALPGTAKDLLQWRIGLINGAGSTTETNTTKDIAVRLTTLPIKEVEIGVSGYNRYVGAAELNGSHVGAHVKIEMKDPFPWFFTAEYVGGNNAALSKLTQDLIFTWEGIVLTTGGWEFGPTIRVESWDPDLATASDEITHITPALNIYFEKNTRFLIDYVMKSESTNINNNRANVMFQIKY